MNKPLTQTMLCLVAVAGMLCAPAAFAGRGRLAGWHGGYGYGHAWRDHRDWGHERWGDRHGDWHYVRDHDGFGHWVAGALVLGALTNLVIDATQPRVVYYGRPPVVYSRTRVIYRDRPPVRVYREETVYGDPYDTRYIGHEDDDEGDR